MTRTDEMACIELIEVVSDYLERMLPEDDPRRFEQHLEKCPYCVEYVAQFRQTIDAVGRLSIESIPPSDGRRFWRRSGPGPSESARAGVPVRPGCCSAQPQPVLLPQLLQV